MKAAETGSVVSVPNTQQNTKPSIPLKRSIPTAEIGDAGTRMMHGVIADDYNPNLQGIQGIKVYDEMRRSDGTVRAAMLVTTLPIRRAKWFVNPATDDQKDKDIANFIEHAIFDWLDISWDDVIRQALLMVPFGVMVFEKVYGTKEHEGKTYVTLSKLAPRLPKSIQQWELTDGTFGIQQIRQDGQSAQIPGSKLLIFVNEREGDNWFGTSMLRPAYKHWYYKNNFYKIDALAFERQGLGVPIIKMPAGYTVTDEQKAIQAAQNLRANESAYMILPPDYTAEFMDMGSGTTRDPQNSINHHNKEILQSVLAQFLELGQTSSGGSRALSEDHSDLFLKAMEAVANTISSEINKNLIPELVDMNFDGVTVYPIIDYSGIARIDVAGLATAYSSLVTAGALKPIADDEQYIRAAMGLPARTQDDDIEDDPNNKDKQDGIDIDVPAGDDQEDIDEGEPADDTEEVEDGMDNAEEDKPTAADNAETTETTGKKKSQVDKVAASHTHHKAKRTFAAGDGFMSWRPLTFAEKKVSWENIQNTMGELDDSFTQEAKDALNASKDVFMKKLHAAIEDNDLKAISDLEIKFIAEYKSILKDAMKKAYEYGKSNASKEMGVPTPPNSASSLAAIDLQADTIANKTASDIESKAKIATSNAIKSNKSNLQIVGEIDLVLQEAIGKAVDSTAAVVVGQSINIGRNDVFQRNTAMIYALQRSEILDEVTCNFCLSMDGLIIEPDDKWAATDIFHGDCRGIWVEILKDEENPPEITGVPDNLGDYYGGQPNALVQPPRIIKPK